MDQPEGQVGRVGFEFPILTRLIIVPGLRHTYIGQLDYDPTQLPSVFKVILYVGEVL